MSPHQPDSASSAPAPALPALAGLPTPQAVRAFLAEHPDCLLWPDFAETLARMMVPRPQPGPAEAPASFTAYWNQRLRAALAVTESRLDAALTIARHNLWTQERILGLAVEMVQTRDLDRLLRLLVVSLPDRLGIDIAFLCLESPLQRRNPIPRHDLIRAMPSGAAALFLPPGEPLAVPPPPASPTLFGPMAPVIGSQMLLRLTIPAGTLKPIPGILALGSRQAEAFTPDQATDLVDFLARIAEQRLGDLLA